MKFAAFALISALTLTAASQAQEIQQRKYNQQARIANGVRSGELTHLRQPAQSIRSTPLTVKSATCAP